MVNFLNIWGMFQAFIVGVIFAFVGAILIDKLIGMGGVLGSADNDILLIIKIINWIAFGIIFPMAMGFGRDNE